MDIFILKQFVVLMQIKEYVLSAKGYEESSDGFKIKSRIVTTNIWVENISRKKDLSTNRTKTSSFFYSPDYTKRARYERENAIETN